MSSISRLLSSPVASLASTPPTPAPTAGAGSPAVSAPAAPVEKKPFLEDLNEALSKMIQVNAAPSDLFGRDIMQLMRCMDEVQRLLPKGEIDLSEESDYGINKFMSLFLASYRLLVHQPEYATSAQTLSKILDAIGNQPAKKEDDPYGLDFGTCFGDALAGIKESAPSSSKETERRGRYFHVAFKINAGYTNKQYPEEIGRVLLANAEHCSYIIQKAAHTLGYENSKDGQVKFLEDLKAGKTPRPYPAVAILIGKIAIELCKIQEEINSNIKQIQAKQQRIMEILSKAIHVLKPPVFDSDDENEASESGPSDLVQEASDSDKTEKEKDALMREVAALRQRNDELRKETELFRPQEQFVRKTIQTVKENKPVDWFFPNRILKAQGIPKDKKIISRIPIDQLAVKLQQLSDKKGKFVLNLFSDDKDTASHAILFSFDPPFISDINDLTVGTRKRIIRQFKTEAELLAFIPDYLKHHYKNYNFNTAGLLRYDVDTTVSLSSASGKAAKEPKEKKGSPLTKDAPKVVSSHAASVSKKDETDTCRDLLIEKAPGFDWKKNAGQKKIWFAGTLEKAKALSEYFKKYGIKHSDPANSTQGWLVVLTNSDSDLIKKLPPYEQWLKEKPSQKN